MKEKRDWASYNILKDELYNGNLSSELNFTTITYMGSFLKWKNLNNEENTGQELVSLYNYGLNKEILFPNNKIPLTAFATIITIGSKTNNYLWAENFIYKYSHLVSDQNTDQIKVYGLAHLNYTKKNFEKTIELLRSKKINNYTLELKAKWLLISSHYELNTNDVNNLKYYITSLKSYIKRNKEKTAIDGSTGFLNSLKFFDRLIIGKNLVTLTKDIKDEKIMVHKKWFLEKIKGLQAKTHNPS